MEDDEIKIPLPPLSKFSALIDTRNACSVDGKSYPNIDAMYGPYNNKDDAWRALSSPNDKGVTALVVGKTVGIIENGKIIEYWFERNCSSKSDLVVKVNSSGGESGGDDTERTVDPFPGTTFSEMKSEIENFSVTIPQIIMPTGTQYRIDVGFNDLISSNGIAKSPVENTLTTALNNGYRNIVLYFQKGEYYCNKRITLNFQLTDANISFVGEEGAVIIGGTTHFNIQDATGILGTYAVFDMPLDITYSYNNPFYSEHCGCNFDYWYRDFIYTDALINVTALGDSLYECRIDNCIYPDKPSSECTDLYVQITEWYLTNIYKVTKIENSSLYFSASNLKAGHEPSGANGYAVNNDYYYGRTNPRYKLINYRDGYNIAIENGKCYVPMRMGNVTLCQTDNFILVSGKYHTVNVCNLTIKGFSKQAIRINSCTVDSFLVNGCTFESVYSAFLSMYSNNNHIINNHIDYTIVSAIDFNQDENGSADYSEAINNTIWHGAMNNSNKGSIHASCNQYLIKDNKIYDYGYAGIFVGVWHSTNNQNPCIGIAERNYLMYTDEYFSSQVHGAMDSGGIYVATKTNRCCLKYNFICNYTGAKDNRGIFMDDGAINTYVYQNIVLNIDNSWSIDSRRVDLSSRNPDYGDKTNVGNVFLYNVVNAKYKLQGSGFEQYDPCIKGLNFILHSTDFELESNNTYNVEYEDDYDIYQCVVSDDVIYVPKNYKSIIDNLNLNIRKYFHFIN